MHLEWDDNAISKFYHTNFSIEDLFFTVAYWFNYFQKGLKKPKVTKEKIPAKDFRKNPKPKKGYQIVKDSIVSGISDLTGMPYLFYTQIKDRDHAGNKPIHPYGTERKRKRKRACGIRAGDHPPERGKGIP